MSEKITAEHCQREAWVYVRQSSREQVLHNHEGRRRQYELAERARQLGFAQVMVVDEDLGRSGSGIEERPGFGRLLDAICQGKVGAVLALEASRLARNNRDWHHLLELCALTSTLVIDYNGVYDPRLLNDRLLLGLQGTMSEFELALLRQRAEEARRRMIARGEVLWILAVGYVRRADNGCEMTPDRQVQQALRAVFAKFRELGSARQVLLWYRQEGLPLPVIAPGPETGQVLWQPPTYGRLIAILKNPIYAGAFVWGRRQTRLRVEEGRARRMEGCFVPRQQWPVLILDHHPAYISWEEYLDNQQRLEDNAAMQGRMNRGAPRKGAALLAGLLRCGRCGRRLHVAYSGIKGRVPRYSCQGGNINHGTKRCISVGGRRVDEAVTQQVLQALEPVGIEAALTAWDELQRRDDAKTSALALAVEKARYEADRARRQYDAVEPENRLVAAELERRWNEALQRVTQLQGRLDEESPATGPLGQTERQRLTELGRDLQTAWHHPQAPAELKKRILRTVLEEVVTDVIEEPPTIVLWLHWAGGTHTLVQVRGQRTGQHYRTTDRQVIELVGELAKVCRDEAIACILNRLGYRSGAGNTWTQARVRSLRCYHEIPVFDRTAGRSWVTLEEATEALGVSHKVLRRLHLEGILPARQVVRYAPWVIERSALELPAVRAAIEAIHRGRRTPPPACGQRPLPFTKAL